MKTSEKYRNKALDHEKLGKETEDYAGQTSQLNGIPSPAEFHKRWSRLQYWQLKAP